MSRRARVHFINNPDRFSVKSRACTQMGRRPLCGQCPGWVGRCVPAAPMGALRGLRNARCARGSSARARQGAPQPAESASGPRAPGVAPENRGDKGRLGPPGSGPRPAERLSPPCPGTQRLSPPCSGEWPVRRLTRAAPGRGQRSGWAGPRAERTDSSVSAGLPLGFPVPYSTSDVLCDSNLGGRALNEIWYWEYSIRLSLKFSTQIWVLWNAAC